MEILSRLRRFSGFLSRAACRFPPFGAQKKQARAPVFMVSLPSVELCRMTVSRIFPEPLKLLLCRCELVADFHIIVCDIQGSKHGKLDIIQVRIRFFELRQFLVDVQGDSVDIFRAVCSADRIFFSADTDDRLWFFHAAFPLSSGFSSIIQQALLFHNLHYLSLIHIYPAPRGQPAQARFPPAGPCPLQARPKARGKLRAHASKQK